MCVCVVKLCLELYSFFSILFFKWSAATHSLNGSGNKFLEFFWNSFSFLHGVWGATQYKKSVSKCFTTLRYTPRQSERV